MMYYDMYRCTIFPLYAECTVLLYLRALDDRYTKSHINSSDRLHSSGSVSSSISAPKTNLANNAPLARKHQQR